MYLCVLCGSENKQRLFPYAVEEGESVSPHLGGGASESSQASTARSSGRSLCRINCLVFITKTDCVYCAVRTGSSSIIDVKLGLKTVP